MLQEANGSTADLRAVFMKLATTTDPYMGGRRTHGSLACLNIPHSTQSYRVFGLCPSSGL
jgi:hypothetical protein